MATFLDVTGLEYFSSFFVFLFVWVAVYAVLSVTKVLGDNKLIQAIIGLVIALLVLFSKTATSVIRYISPWFAVLFIVIIFVAISAQLFGISPGDFPSYPAVKWSVLTIIILLFIVGTLAYVRTESGIIKNETGLKKDYSKTSVILFHPKVLGVIFILLVSIFTIALLAAKER